MLNKILYVFIGGGLGSTIRFLITQMDYEFLKSYKGTLFVNILGSFLIGFFLAVLNEKNTNLNFLLIVGFTGGLTTFSTFALDIVNIELNNIILITFYITFSVLGAILGLLFGTFLGNKIVN